MKPSLRSLAGGVVLAASLLGACATQAQTASPPSEQPFLDENNAVMDRMMAGMAVKPSGDVDRDFVEMMIPHHQGAIDMAMAVLKYGKNEQLRRIAQEIIVDQQQEIAAMRLALGDPPPPSAPAPTQAPNPAGGPAAGPAPSSASHQHHHE